MKADTSIPNEITHPETGARMVLDTSQGSNVMEHRLTRNVGIAQGGQEALAKIREKEQEEGYIYVDPQTGYKSRVRIENGQPVAARRDDDQGGSGGARDQGGDDRESELARLRRRINELGG